MTEGADWIAALWEEVRPSAAAKVDVIIEAIEQLHGAGAETRRAAAWQEAHRLAGSLGTYGLHDGASAAAELENLLAEPGPLADQARARAAAAKLKAAVDGDQG